MATCTIFKNFATPVENVSLIILSNWIASDKYKFQVEEIRSLIAQGRTEEATLKKQQLSAFTPSATFKEKRLLTHVEQYSGFVHLDFDKLLPEQLEKAFKIITETSYTFLCFLSPGGKGLKVFVEVNTEIEQHDIAYQQVKQFYEVQLGITSDPKCKDITRLCFVSYDPQLYKNIYNEKFLVNIIEITTSEQPVPLIQEETEYTSALLECVKFTEQKKTYNEGSRNEFIYVLASNCNRKGIPQEIALQFALSNYDLPDKEIKASFKSAYTHHNNEFAKFANAATLQSQTPEQIHDDEDSLADYLKSTPTIPDHIYEALPDILKEGAKAFTDKRKRDVFFTGAIPIISGCLPNVTGVYFQERVYPHLYTFIIAPAASGKGVLKNAKRLADKYHQKILSSSREAQKIYENEMAEYKKQQYSKNKNESAKEKPVEPPFKIVFIPADCSQSRMIEHLQQNDGQGIICETEADTMSGTKKQDWGDYSPILRAAFHHEKIAISRKTNNEYVEINEPRLAVALSGTPSQAPKLIASAEDGLFSRFLFYAYKNEIEWQDPSPNNHTIIYNDHFDTLADRVLQLITFLDQSPTEIKLHSEQWNLLNTTFTKMLSEVTIFTSEEASGVVYRLGLILFRLCMIFSSLRKCENAEAEETIYCTDEDFNTALEIAQIYLQHSLLMFNNLPKQNEAMQFRGGDGKRNFFDALPKEFTRKQATEVGAKFKLSARTVDEILKSSTGKSLTKIKAGLYQRI